MGPVHVAETREQARADVRFGLEKWIYYFREVANLPLAVDGKDPIDTMIKSGLAVIGTPDDCVAQIERLHLQSGRLRMLPATRPQLGGLGGDQAIV